jgi:hypothetical protein
MLVVIERDRHANSPMTSAPVGTTIQKEIGASYK